MLRSAVRGRDDALEAWSLTMSMGAVLEVGAVLAAAVMAGSVVDRRPWLAVVLWLCAIAFVPIWLGVNVYVFVWPTTAVGAFVLLAVRPPLPRQWSSADLVVILFFVSCVAPILIGGATVSTLYGAIAQWLLAFWVGRMLPMATEPARISVCIAVVFGVVAGLAILEFLLRWNPFLTIGPTNALHSYWGAVQTRGGVARVEGAFGHSIALGSSLALAIPFMVTARLPAVFRVFLVVLAMVATMLTLSRVSMIGAALALVGSLYFCREAVTRSVRTSLTALLALGVVVAVPLLLTVFADAGSEAAGSADYRSSLTELIASIAPLGFSAAAHRNASGDLYFGKFQSIDNALIFGGLTYGWFALVLALILLLAAIWATVRRRASAATIAVVAQIPALASVALITQYSVFFWFVVGLSVASATVGEVERDPQRVGEVERDPQRSGSVKSIQRMHMPATVGQHSTGATHVNR